MAQREGRAYAFPHWAAIGVAGPRLYIARSPHYHRCVSFDAPIAVTGSPVLPEWVDYNGHMNVAYYLLNFDRALDVMYDQIDIGIDYKRRTSNSTFTLQCLINYSRELLEGAPLSYTFQLLDYDKKRMHFFGRMFHAEEDYMAATLEWLAIHVNLETRRAADMEAETLAAFAELSEAHAGLPQPPEAGRAIGIAREKVN